MWFAFREFEKCIFENGSIIIQYQIISAIGKRGTGKIFAKRPRVRAMKDIRECEKFFEMWKDADDNLPALIAAKKEYAELD